VASTSRLSQPLTPMRYTTSQGEISEEKDRYPFRGNARNQSPILLRRHCCLTKNSAMGICRFTSAMCGRANFTRSKFFPHNSRRILRISRNSRIFPANVN